MKINKDGVGVQYFDPERASFCLIEGINCVTQGDIEVDLCGCNSYVITSLDYLVENTERLLSNAKELIRKRDNSEL